MPVNREEPHQFVLLLDLFKVVVVDKLPGFLGEVVVVCELLLREIVVADEILLGAVVFVVELVGKHHQLLLLLKLRLDCSSMRLLDYLTLSFEEGVKFLDRTFFQRGLLHQLPVCGIFHPELLLRRLPWLRLTLRFKAPLV